MSSHAGNPETERHKRYSRLSPEQAQTLKRTIIELKGRIQDAIANMPGSPRDFVGKDLDGCCNIAFQHIDDRQNNYGPEGVYRQFKKKFVQISKKSSLSNLSEDTYRDRVIAPTKAILLAAYCEDEGLLNPAQGVDAINRLADTFTEQAKISFTTSPERM